MTKSISMDTNAKNRAKGKWVMIGGGPKSSPLALRPNNGKFGVKVIARHEVFDDGSKLRLKGATDRGKNIQGRPSDEMMRNHLHDSVELKSDAWNDEWLSGIKVITSIVAGKMGGSCPTYSEGSKWSCGSHG
ncbi:hypothetical protein Goari_010441 [Gossypium aridum]|uniref:Uncharacterized protein n=1 Tax=Gossypium aridum TaxID=34290 RepID=A0A7J8Y0V3_GOSAI|nr:hypothetical protein [Gossypium aridum]